MLASFSFTFNGVFFKLNLLVAILITVRTFQLVQFCWLNSICYYMALMTFKICLIYLLMFNMLVLGVLQTLLRVLQLLHQMGCLLFGLDEQWLLPIQLLLLFSHVFLQLLHLSVQFAHFFLTRLHIFVCFVSFAHHFL